MFLLGLPSLVYAVVLLIELIIPAGEHAVKLPPPAPLELTNMQMALQNKANSNPFHPAPLVLCPDHPCVRVQGDELRARARSVNGVSASSDGKGAAAVEEAAADASTSSKGAVRSLMDGMRGKKQATPASAP